MYMLDEMSITAKKDEVLASLRKNREQHAQIVREAREGYVEQAKKALEQRLGQIREGKIVALTFSLTPPIDQTKVYDTAIKMLELHTDTEIELTAQQVRNLVMDEWDWSNQFIGTNKIYSNTAAMLDR